MHYISQQNEVFNLLECNKNFLKKSNISCWTHLLQPRIAVISLSQGMELSSGMKQHIPTTCYFLVMMALI